MSGLLGLLLLSGCGGPAAPPGPPPAPVRIAHVERKDVAHEVQLPGTVVPLTTSDVASGAAGKVITYPVREGERVSEGDVLAELRSVTLSIEIAAARESLNEKEQRLAELAAGYRPEEVRQAEAAMKAAAADDVYAKIRLKRVTDLHRDSAATDDMLEQSQSAETRAAEVLAEAKAHFELKRSGYRPEVVAQAHAAAESQKLEVARLEDEMKKRTIRAPFAGFVVQKYSDIGQWIEKGGSVARMIDLTEVDVVVNVEESLTHLVHLNQPVEIRFDALKDRAIAGFVKEFVPKSDWRGGSRSFPVKVRVKNEPMPDGRPLLKEGMLARVILRGKQHAATLVHKDAIVRSSGSPVVYRLDAEDRVEQLPVEELLSYGNLIEVAGPLNPGDRLVIEGNERLRPAQKVKILDNPAPGKPQPESQVREVAGKRKA